MYIDKKMRQYDPAWCRKYILPSLFSHMNTGKFCQIYKLQHANRVCASGRDDHKENITRVPDDSFMKEASIKREEVTMREKAIMHSFFQDGEKTVTRPQISCGYFSTM